LRRQTPLQHMLFVCVRNVTKSRQKRGRGGTSCALGQLVRWFAAARADGPPYLPDSEFPVRRLRGSSPIPGSPGHSPWGFHGARAAHHRTAPFFFLPFAPWLFISLAPGDRARRGENKSKSQGESESRGGSASPSKNGKEAGARLPASPAPASASGGFDDQSILMSICLGLASGASGRVSVRTPSLYAAAILSRSTVWGRVIARENVPQRVSSWW